MAEGHQEPQVTEVDGEDMDVDANQRVDTNLDTAEDTGVSGRLITGILLFGGGSGGPASKCLCPQDIHSMERGCVPSSAPYVWHSQRFGCVALREHVFLDRRPGIQGRTREPMRISAVRQEDKVFCLWGWLRQQ